MKRLLFLSILAAFGLSIDSCQQSTENTALRTVDAAAFKQIVDAHNAVIIDVRRPDEFSESHLDGALNIDVEDASFQEKIKSLDKSETYLVYCRAGRRSMNAANQMTSAGFKDVVNLEGGITGWMDNGYPVTK
ncbi:MAG: hypothetical protein RL021_1556 [Bacteroidota bacterium]